MFGYILIILGIVAEVVKANQWFVIPSIVSYLLFGIGGLIVIIGWINYFVISKKVNKEFNKFDRRW